MREGLHIVFRILCIMMVVAVENMLMPTQKEQRKKQGVLEWTALLGVCVLTVLMEERKHPGEVEEACWDCFMQNLFWGNLLLALLQDVRESLVYRVIWLIIMLVLGFQILQNGIEPTSLLSVLFYCTFQELIGSRFYGRADCHCFSCTAFFMMTRGIYIGEILQFLVIHMVVSFLLLGVVSVLQGNLNRKGNLLYPVPLIPYIYLSLLVLLNSEV